MTNINIDSQDIGNLSSEDFEELYNLVLMENEMRNNF